MYSSHARQFETIDDDVADVILFEVKHAIVVTLSIIDSFFYITLFPFFPWKLFRPGESHTIHHLPHCRRRRLAREVKDAVAAAASNKKDTRTKKKERLLDSRTQSISRAAVLLLLLLHYIS